MNPKIETADTATPSDEQRLAELGYKQELKRGMTLTDVVVYGLISWSQLPEWGSSKPSSTSPTA